MTNAEGNTVKVTTSPATSVTKTVKADVKGIHPGETVLVTGAAGANGAISAESIRVGWRAAAVSAALFGGSGAGSRWRRWAVAAAAAQAAAALARPCSATAADTRP